MMCCFSVGCLWVWVCSISCLFVLVECACCLIEWFIVVDLFGVGFMFALMLCLRVFDCLFRVLLSGDLMVFHLFYSLFLYIITLCCYMRVVCCCSLACCC